MFPLLAISLMGAWAFLDFRHGELPAWIFIPLLAVPFFNPMGFLIYFIIPFMGMLALKLKAGVKFGMADALAVPFALFFLSGLQSLALVGMAVPIVYLIMKKPKYTRFIPYLFLGCLCSLLIHSGLRWLFPYFFL